MTMNHEKTCMLFYPRAWVYTRPQDRHQLVGQKWNALGTARQYGFEVVGASEDLYGAHRIWRPGLMALLCAVHARSVDVVVVPQLSALTCNRQCLGWILRMFHKHRVSVITTGCDLRNDLYRHRLVDVLQ